MASFVWQPPKFTSAISNSVPTYVWPPQSGGGPPPFTVTNSVTFNGSSSYLISGAASNVDFNAMTDAYWISCWVKLASDVSTRVFVSRLEPVNFAGPYYFTSASGNMAIQIASNENTAHYIEVHTANHAIPVGQWCFLAMSYNGNGTAAGVSFYMDGIPVSVTVGKDTLNASTVSGVPFTVGKDNFASGEFFNGEMCQLCIGHGALTQDNVTSLYLNGLVNSPQPGAVGATLVSYYPMGSGTDTTSVIHDVQDGNDLAGTNITITTDVPSATPTVDWFLTTSGTTTNTISGAATNLDFEYTSPYSISFWFKNPGATPGIQAFLSRLSNSPVFKGPYYIPFQSHGDGTASIAMEISHNEDSSVHYIYVTGTMSFTANQLYFCTVTYDGSGVAAGIKIYIDASALTLTVVQDNLSGLTSVSGVPFMIGGDNWGTAAFGGEPMVGSIKSLGFWSKELSGAEVTTLHGLGEKAALAGMPNLVSTYTCNQSFLDAGGGGNNLTNQGAYFTAD